MSGSLDYSPARVLLSALADLSLGAIGASQWALYAAFMPDRPDDAISLYNTTGLTQGRIQINGETQEQHGIQVRIRSATEEAGWAKARAIAVALDTSIRETEVSVASDAFILHSTNRTSDVISLGLESPTTKRRLYTINVTASIRQLAGT